MKEYPVLIGHATGETKKLHSTQQVADFICRHGVREDVSVTYEDGRPFLNTFGIYIDRIADMEYRDELLKILIPMQRKMDGTSEIEDNELQEAEQRKSLKIGSLAELKRHIKPGTEIMATYHSKHPDIVGLVREVTKVQTNGFYSVIKGQPGHRFSQGPGFRSGFQKAGEYIFDGTTIKVLDSRKKDGSILYELEVYEPELRMNNNHKEEHTVNDWDRLHRQAERYKQSYPPGTRVMLLNMGSDPCPVEDNTRGTVVAVDDIGTVHCAFDNGRALGLVPGEDSFRKLTEEELQQEQAPTMAGPALDM